MLLSSILLFAPEARSEPESIRIEYQAESECPTKQEFTTQVLERTDSARLVRGSEGARTFVIQIRGQRGQVSGSLVIREPDGTTVARTFEGAHCAEVAMALALATALAIDPGASFAPRSDPSGPISREPPELDVAEPDAGGSLTQGHWELAVGPAVTVGWAPKWAYGGSILVQRAMRSEAGALLSLGMEVSAQVAPSHAVDGARARFQLFSVAPQVCAFNAAFSDALALAPCVAVAIGAIRAAGYGLPEEGRDSRFWSSVQLGSRLRVTLTERWFARGDAQLVLPLTRYRYHFDDPETAVYQIPAMGARFDLRLGFSL